MEAPRSRNPQQRHLAVGWLAQESCGPWEGSLRTGRPPWRWSGQRKAGVLVFVRSRAGGAPSWSTNVALPQRWLELPVSPGSRGKGGVVTTHAMRLVRITICTEYYCWTNTQRTVCAPQPEHRSTRGCRNRGGFSGGTRPSPSQPQGAASRRRSSPSDHWPNVTRGCSLGLQGGGGAGLAAVVGSKRVGSRAAIGSDEALGCSSQAPPDWPLANLLGFLRLDLGSCLLGRWHPEERNQLRHVVGLRKQSAERCFHAAAHRAGFSAGQPGPLALSSMSWTAAIV